MVPKQTCPEIDVLTATAGDLKKLLDSKQVTSRQLVQIYLRQIQHHNTEGLNLRALIDIAPEALVLGQAEKLDNERAAEKTRGDYHGIPIVLKDTINTDPALGMRRTLGSFALCSAWPAKDAAVVEVLHRQGLIILAKANLSEFGTNKCPGRHPSGWSAIGGQTQSPYVEGGVRDGDSPLGHSTPGGSSSGSAVAVAAGFVTWSIGAETDGSLQTPANRAALYALKPTIGAVSGDGVFRLTDAFDSLGGMAKSAHDLAGLTEILLLTVPGTAVHGKKLRLDDMTEIGKLRLGIGDPDEWTLPHSLLEPDEGYLQQRKDQWQATIDRLESVGMTIVATVKLKKASEYEFEGKSAYRVIRYGGWKPIVSEYLSNLSSTEVHSLGDIVKFAEDHPELEFSEACPNQTSLYAALEDQTSPDPVESAIRYVREEAGPNDIDQVMTEHKLDAILAPTESQICTIASFAGYPIGTMPMGYLEPSGRPHGISVLSSKFNEAKILEIMQAYEQVFDRKSPPQLSHRRVSQEQANL